MTTIDALELQVETNFDEASKSINSLISSLEKLESIAKRDLGLGRIGKQLEALADATLKKAVSNISSIDNVISKVAGLSGVKISPNIATQLYKISDSVNSFSNSGVAKLDNVTSGLEKLASVGVRLPKIDLGKVQSGTPDISNVSIGGVETASEGVTTKLTRALEFVSKNVVSTSSDINTNLTNSLSTPTSKLEMLKNKTLQVGTALKTLGGATLGKLGQGLQLGVTGIKLLGTGTAKVISLAKTLRSEYKGAGKQVVKLAGKMINPLLGNIGKLLSSIRRIALYRTIRFLTSSLVAGTKEGINNLYRFSSVMNGVFAQSLNNISTNMLYLRNSIGAMVSPLINALAPAIDFVISKLVALMNILNSFFSRLGGASTFTRARKQAKNFGAALGGVGGSAKKMAKEIKDATTGIDELNIISQPDDTAPSGGGGGGGASTPDFGSMFEEVPIPDSIKNFTDRIKTLWEKSDWKGLGTLIGKSINDALVGIDWAGSGATIGRGIKGIIDTTYYALKNIDFYTLGTNFAVSFNNIFDNIDFANMGRLLVRGIGSIVSILVGFITGLDWGVIAKSISGFLTGALNELAEYISNWDFSDTMEGILNRSWDFIKNFDWLGFIKSIGNVLLSILKQIVKWIFIGLPKTAAAFYKNAFKIFSELKTKVLNYVKNNGGWLQVGKDLISGLLNGIVNMLSNIWQWVKDNIFKPLWDAVKSAFGIASPSKKMGEIGGWIVEGLYNGITGLISSGISIITGWASSIFNWFTGGDGKGNIVTKFKNTASNIVSGFGDKISNTYNTVKDTITGWADSVYNWFTGGSGSNSMENKFEGVAVGSIGAFKKGINNSKNSVSATMLGLASTVNQSFTSDGKVNSGTYAYVGGAVVQGFKNGIDRNKNSTQPVMKNWGNNTNAWFGSATSSSVYENSARNVVLGFAGGITKFNHLAKASMFTWGGNMLSWFEQRLKIKSPSREFAKRGFYTVQGFNKGITDNMSSTMNVIDDWTDSILQMQPDFTMKTNVDSSNMDSYMRGLQPINVDGMAQQHYKVSFADREDDFERFYVERIEPTLYRIADEVKRQADKKTETVVNIGKRTIREVIDEQENADGYSFTR